MLFCKFCIMGEPTTAFAYTRKDNGQREEIQLCDDCKEDFIKAVTKIGCTIEGDF
jgi:hypothetical protein